MSNEKQQTADSEKIIYEGYWYAYIHRLGQNEEICLATLNPKKYCNGLYSFSQKDPGDGMAFVVIDTNEPLTKAELILKEANQNLS